MHEKYFKNGWNDEMEGIEFDPAYVPAEYRESYEEGRFKARNNKAGIDPSVICTAAALRKFSSHAWDVV